MKTETKKKNYKLNTSFLFFLLLSHLRARSSCSKFGGCCCCCSCCCCCCWERCCCSSLITRSRRRRPPLFFFFFEHKFRSPKKEVRSPFPPNRPLFTISLLLPFSSFDYHQCMLSFSSREFVELVPPDGARGREREDGGGGFRGLGGSGGRGRGRKGRRLLFSFFTVCVLWGRRGRGTLFSRWAAVALFFLFIIFQSSSGKGREVQKEAFLKTGRPSWARGSTAVSFSISTQRGVGVRGASDILFFFSPPQPPSRRLDPPSSLSNTTGWTLFEPDCCRDLLFRLSALRRSSSLF